MIKWLDPLVKCSKRWSGLVTKCWHSFALYLRNSMTISECLKSPKYEGFCAFTSFLPVRRFQSFTIHWVICNCKQSQNYKFWRKIHRRLCSMCTSKTNSVLSLVFSSSFRRFKKVANVTRKIVCTSRARALDLLSWRQPPDQFLRTLKRGNFFEAYSTTKLRNLISKKVK